MKRLKQIHSEHVPKPMMAAAPTASDIITTPTHDAVALACESGKMGAPVCVAKGLDHIAHKIGALQVREMAVAQIIGLERQSRIRAYRAS